jgi:hypothetical protein
MHRATKRAPRECELERIFELPLPQQFMTSRLAELVGGLRAAEEAERRGESGDDHMARGVINAAMLNDREQGRPIDTHMTLGRAMARLKEQD